MHGEILIRIRKSKVKMMGDDEERVRVGCENTCPYTVVEKGVSINNCTYDRYIDR